MSGQFGSPLMRFLRRLKARFTEREGTRGYQRRLERETRRVARTFAGELQPVLIHTYGKVGSTAIQTVINKLPGFGSFQTHFISEEGVNLARAIHQDHDRDPIHLKVGEALRRAMEEYPDKVVRVITLVRDPVARAVSNLFENPVLLLGEGGGDLRKMPVEQVVEIAAEQLRSSIDYTEGWFDRELSQLFGFEFFSEPFDRESGFQILKKGRVHLLSGKLELLSNNGGRYLGDFLGLSAPLDIPRRRARESTGEASLYDQVRKSLKLPAGVLDEVYSSRVCRQFYTPEELEGFRKLWQA